MKRVRKTREKRERDNSGLQLVDEADLTFVGVIPNSRSISENREDACPVEEANVGLREATDSIGKNTKTSDDGGGVSTHDLHMFVE